MIEAVGEKMGVEVKFQETQWDAIFAGLDAGRFDVIANQVSINPEREEKYLFTQPYTVSTGVVMEGIPGFAPDLCEYCAYDPVQATTLFEEWQAEGGSLGDIVRIP